MKAERVRKSLGVLDALDPVVVDPNISPETHEQAMGCLSCGLAGMTPPDDFPQQPGLWARPCPKCGEKTVWVAKPRLIQSALTPVPASRR